jgi:hypothetical protein
LLLEPLHFCGDHTAMPQDDADQHGCGGDRKG